MARKYRLRTRLRRRAPARLVGLFRKGKHDTGDHDWYLVRHEPLMYRCYHCTVGVAHGDPLSPGDRLVRASKALRSVARVEQMLKRSGSELGDWGLRAIARWRRQVLESLDRLPGGSAGPTGVNGPG